MDPELVEQLEISAASSNRKGRARKNTYHLWGHPEIGITSWKYMDWDYYAPNLPVYARGLFTIGDRIVVRGYDKFFNIDEVLSTKWEDLIAHTTGPYCATTKENGCIIFISGYDGKLVVTSKHSTGPRDDSKNHSAVGQQWVRKYLDAVGKTEQELAEELEHESITAVGELCDDAFEEHVLAYKPSEAGIYLTGLNSNQRTFFTRPMEEVAEFARKYGFRETKYTVKDDINALKAFVESCSTDGSWQGREIEGFVVRCKRDGQDFFFKYKFDEPYFMYRQWREVTKSYLQNPNAPPKFHPKHRESCTRYLQFLTKYIPSHPEYRTLILNDHKGIIDLRNRFLEYCGMNEQELLNMFVADLPKKYILVPIAILGCGKTTVSVALSVLNDWGHCQNDDIPSGKNKVKQYILNLIDSLEEHDVVIADRNNHQLRERTQLITDLTQESAARGYELVFVALNFLPEGVTPKVWDITSNRVKNRAGQHQTITDMPDKMVTNIMKGFVGRFQPLMPSASPDDQFDSIVNLSIDKDSSEKNVRAVCDHMRKHYGMNLEFTDEQFHNAMRAAFAYQPKPLVKNTPTRNPKFFGVKVKGDIKQLVLQQFAELPEFLQKYNVSFLEEFHVTLAHANHKHRFRKLCKEFHKSLASAKDVLELDLNQPADVTVKEICWNERIMALRVDLEGIESENAIPHITVAMKDGVNPVESNGMFEFDHEVKRWEQKLNGSMYAYFDS